MRALACHCLPQVLKELRVFGIHDMSAPPTKDLLYRCTLARELFTQPCLLGTALQCLKGECKKRRRHGQQCLRTTSSLAVGWALPQAALSDNIRAPDGPAQPSSAGLALELQQAPLAACFLQDLMPLLACCAVEARRYGLVRLVRRGWGGLGWAGLS